MLADAAEAVVATLTDLGRIESTDLALTNAYVQLAREVDNSDTKDRAGLFREFRAYDAAVRTLGKGDVDDGLGDLIAQLSAPVEHRPPPRASEPG